MKFNQVDKREAATIIGCHWSTLGRYRREGKLIENVHYSKVGGKIRYVKELLEDLVSVGFDLSHPDHKKAIQVYQKSKIGYQGRGQAKCQSA